MVLCSRLSLQIITGRIVKFASPVLGLFRSRFHGSTWFDPNKGQPRSRWKCAPPAVSLLIMSRSGRPRTSHRLLAEDCTSIHPPNYISWPRNREGPIHVDLVATWPDGSNLTIPVDLTSTKTPSGGLRAWFLCPNCSRRCGKLFVVDENDREFRCRLCLDLAYRVQYRKSMRHRVFRLVRKWLAEEQRRQQAQTKI